MLLCRFHRWQKPRAEMCPTPCIQRRCLKGTGLLQLVAREQCSSCCQASLLPTRPAQATAGAQRPEGSSHANASEGLLTAVSAQQSPNRSVCPLSSVLRPRGLSDSPRQHWGQWPHEASAAWKGTVAFFPPRPSNVLPRISEPAPMESPHCTPRRGTRYEQ